MCDHWLRILLSRHFDRSSKMSVLRLLILRRFPFSLYWWNERLVSSNNALAFPSSYLEWWRGGIMLSSSTLVMVRQNSASVVRFSKL